MRGDPHDRNLYAHRHPHHGEEAEHDLQRGHEVLGVERRRLRLQGRNTSSSRKARRSPRSCTAAGTWPTRWTTSTTTPTTPTASSAAPWTPARACGWPSSRRTAPSSNSTRTKTKGRMATATEAGRGAGRFQQAPARPPARVVPRCVLIYRKTFDQPLARKGNRARISRLFTQARESPPPDSALRLLMGRSNTRQRAHRAASVSQANPWPCAAGFFIEARRREGKEGERDSCSGA